MYSKNFPKLLTFFFQNWLLFLAVVCFGTGVILVVIKQNSSEPKTDEIYDDFSKNQSFEWPNYGVGIWSSVFVS